MKIFKKIWNFFFGNKQNQERYKAGGIFEQEIKEDFSVKQEIEQVQNPSIFTDNNKPLIDIPNGDDFFAFNQIIEKEKKMDSEFANLPKKKSKKMNIGKKTLSEIKQHILENGSLNTYACKQIFKVKSLHNFISALRSQGFVFITEKMVIKDVSGRVIEKATNYTLIDQK